MGDNSGIPYPVDLKSRIAISGVPERQLNNMIQTALS